MKKSMAILLTALFSISVFAQTKVDAKKIGKTLESNKDAAAVFNCDMSLSGIKVADDGTISLPLFAKFRESYPIYRRYLWCNNLFIKTIVYSWKKRFEK